MAVNQPPFNPKTRNKASSLIIMIAVAALCGLFAAIGIWQYLAQTQKKVKELSITRAVVVASKKIPAGTKLTEEYLVIKEFPEKAVPKDYPTSIASLKDRIIKTTILPDEIITESRLVGQGASGGLPFIIPAGQRAITIKVDEIAGIGGFINPGDHVDIVAILNKGDEQNISKTILQDVLVIAVGDKVLDPNALSEASAKVVSQITVALTPQESEKLALAQNLGQLQLVLRPNGDNTVASTTGATIGDVYGYSGSQSQGPGSAIVSTGKLPGNSIEIILGDEKTYQYY